MTTCTAEEAELSDPSTCPEPTRPRTDDPSNERASLSDSEQGDALDALTYIRAPSRDPLEIHGWDQSTTMENLSRAQGDMWMNEEGAKILAYRAYGGKINDIDDLAKLRNDIKSTLGINTNPIVAVPIPETGRTKKDTPPFCTLVKGITPEQARELVTRVRPNHPPPPLGKLTPNSTLAIHIHEGVHDSLHPIHTPALLVHDHPQGFRLL